METASSAKAIPRRVIAFCAEIVVARRPARYRQSSAFPSRARACETPGIEPITDEALCGRGGSRRALAPRPGGCGAGPVRSQGNWAAATADRRRSRHRRLVAAATTAATCIHLVPYGRLKPPGRRRRCACRPAGDCTRRSPGRGERPRGPAHAVLRDAHGEHSNESDVCGRGLRRWASSSSSVEPITVRELRLAG